jgi:hypothetical protein
LAARPAAKIKMLQLGSQARFRVKPIRKRAAAQPIA